MRNFASKFSGKDRKDGGYNKGDDMNSLLGRTGTKMGISHVAVLLATKSTL
jgi:hypothetical protein